jgi:hypothetical protein
MAPDPFSHHRWLISEEAQPWLAEMSAELAGRPPSPAQIRSYRERLGTIRALLVFEQVELRARAAEKFSRSGELFFTRRGLEQATDEAIAAYKALRFTHASMIADLCCGVGGDAMALAKYAGMVLVDRDPVSLLWASANVQRLAGHDVKTFAEDVAPRHLGSVSAWHIDPDRRPAEKRTTQVDLGDPGVEVLDALLARCPHGAIKLAPAAAVPAAWLAASDREWIESRGECRQQVAWFGDLAEAPGRHTATLLDGQGEACSFVGRGEAAVDEAEKLGRFVYDPSPSLVAARLFGALAEVLELRAVSRHSLYLTGEESLTHPHLQTFEVEAELPLDVRQLKAYLRERKIGRLEIKKRGVPMTPETLRPQLDLAGDGQATLLLMRLESGMRAVVARRLSEES